MIMLNNDYEEGVKISLNDVANKMMAIESMVEVTLKNQARIIAKLEGLDLETIKKEIFENVNKVEDRLFEELSARKE